MVLPVEKKISELEMGLLHLQQNIGIPEINLVIHPTVSQVSGLTTLTGSVQSGNCVLLWICAVGNLAKLRLSCFDYDVA